MDFLVEEFLRMFFFFFVCFYVKMCCYCLCDENVSVCVQRVVWRSVLEQWLFFFVSTCFQ